MRWLEQLENYNFIDARRPSKNIAIQMPYQDYHADNVEVVKFQLLAVRIWSPLHYLQQETTDDLSKEQLADPIIRPVLQAKQINERSNSEEIQSIPLPTRQLFSCDIV